MNTPPDNSGRNRQIFGVMLGLGVAVTLLSMFYSSSHLLVVGLLLALVGCLGSLSTR
jgi:MFS-type transporter involved in bile tolerance (Atg22 family)